MIVSVGAFRALAWCVTAAACGAGGAALLLRGGRIDAPRALRAGLVFAGFEAAALAALHLARVNTFGSIHVAYLALVAGLPALALTALVAARRRGATRTAVALAAAALVGLPIGVWASCVEPYRLVVERADVAVAASRSGEPVRVGVLADLQCVTIGDHERRAVRALVAERPDVILIPGDLVQDGEAGFDRELPALRELFRELEAPGGTFLVVGDVDTREGCRRAVEGTNVRLLDDEVVTSVVRGRTIRILGLLGRDGPRSSAALAAFERAPGDADVRIVLVHRPDPVLELPRNARVDLVVAGHTHGGQVQIPFFGAPMTLSHVPRRVGSGGLHELDGRRVYVSRGVGMERGLAPPVRFLCPPEVSVLTLR